MKDNSVNEAYGERMLVQHSIQQIEKTRQSKENVVLMKLVCMTFISVLFLIVMLIGAILSNSLALMADSLHLFSNMSGFIVSITAICIGSKPKNKLYSFGFHRAEVIGLLLTCVVIWVITAFLCKELVERFQSAVDIDTKIMLFTSIFGVLCNIVIMRALHADDIENHFHNNDLNCTSIVGQNEEDPSSANPEKKEGTKDYRKSNAEGMLFHIFFDILLAISTVSVSMILYFNPRLVIADNLCTIIITLFVFMNSASLTNKCIKIFMDATPEKYKTEEVENYLMTNVIEIISIHDLHIWSIGKNEFKASLHVVSFDKTLTPRIVDILKSRFKISSPTVQIESPEENEKYLNCISGSDN